MSPSLNLRVPAATPLFTTPANRWQQPGEIIFYESASVIHGRPEAFQGDRFANIFVHFSPLEGWDVTSSDVDMAARRGANKKRRENNLEEAKAKAA